MSGDEPSYQLISSLRYDREALLPAQWNTSRNGDKESPYLLLSYTIDRLITAAKLHSWIAPPECALHWLESHCDAFLKDKNVNQPHKVRNKSIMPPLYGTHRTADSGRPLKTGEGLDRVCARSKARKIGRPFVRCYVKSNFFLTAFRTLSFRIP